MQTLSYQALLQGVLSLQHSLCSIASMLAVVHFTALQLSEESVRCQAVLR